MHSYIIIHHTQETFEMALFKNNILYTHQEYDKRLASKMLIPLLNEIITENNISISDLSFIGINQGPGMFSTLRSIIATVNGLHCAVQIPLIGIDALIATTVEYQDDEIPYTATLLNACNNEVYYAISHHKKILSSGYLPITQLLLKLEQELPQETIHCIGTGTILYRDLITNSTGIKPFIKDPVPPLCTISMIGRLAFEKYVQKEYHSYLFPLYLKKHAVEQ